MSKKFESFFDLNILKRLMYINFLSFFYSIPSRFVKTYLESVIHFLLMEFLNVLNFTLFLMNKLIGTKGCSTPMGYAERLRPRRLAEEAKESRPMESEHPVVEINHIYLFVYD